MFENWESEFLQMSTYVVLTAFLFQRGSAESKDPDDPPPQEEDFSVRAYDRHLPGPLRAGPLARKLYAYSLGIVLILLFVASFILHLFGSAQAENPEAALHGHPAVSLLNHLGSARFWFESFQNWQSGVLFHRCPCGPVHIPKVQGLAGIQTRRRTASRNGGLKFKNSRRQRRSNRIGQRAGASRISPCEFEVIGGAISRPPTHLVIRPPEANHRIGCRRFQSRQGARRKF
jgi:hypothetical protein